MMDHPLSDLISQKIREAEKRGEFDNLPGAGKPLPHVDDPDNVVIARILKEAGAVPEYVSLQRELRRLRAELDTCTDDEHRARLLKDVGMLQTRADVARDAHRR